VADVDVFSLHQAYPASPKTPKQWHLPVPATRKYSGDVGQTLAAVEGLSPEFRLTGRELYVRAVVTSSQPHHDPSFKDQRQQAWTQPVGWAVTSPKAAPAAGK